jgi:hypothetical protein
MNGLENQGLPFHQSAVEGEAVQLNAGIGSRNITQVGNIITIVNNAPIILIGNVAGLKEFERALRQGELAALFRVRVPILKNIHLSLKAALFVQMDTIVMQGFSAKTMIEFGLKEVFEEYFILQMTFAQRGRYATPAWCKLNTFHEFCRLFAGMIFRKIIFLYYFNTFCV